jgi:hypothetical protein
MSKAQRARLTIWLTGAIATAFASLAFDLGISGFAFGFVTTGIAAERTFLARATPEETRKHLENRVRFGD